MARLTRLASFAPLLLIGATAADMLPLRQGIYVPVGRPCRGASNAEVVNYWGGRNSIGAAQGSCTIRSVSKVGTTYTIHDRCRDIGSGEVIEGGPTVVTISSPTAFRMNDASYRYCGPRLEF